MPTHNCLTSIVTVCNGIPVKVVRSETRALSRDMALAVALTQAQRAGLAPFWPVPESTAQ